MRPTDEPSRPGKPEIFDYDNKSVQLRWTPPEKDGGRPITHYHVEIKDKLSVDWKEVLQTPDTKCECTVPDLKEGTVYSFRVRAANKAGVGEASEPTENHLCKHKNRKFYFSLLPISITLALGTTQRIPFSCSFHCTLQDTL